MTETLQIESSLIVAFMKIIIQIQNEDNNFKKIKRQELDEAIVEGIDICNWIDRRYSSPNYHLKRTFDDKERELLSKGITNIADAFYHFSKADIIGTEDCALSTIIFYMTAFLDRMDTIIEISSFEE